MLRFSFKTQQSCHHPSLWKYDSKNCRLCNSEFLITVFNLSCDLRFHVWINITLQFNLQKEISRWFKSNLCQRSTDHATGSFGDPWDKIQYLGQLIWPVVYTTHVIRDNGKYVLKFPRKALIIVFLCKFLDDESFFFSLWKGMVYNFVGNFCLHRIKISRFRQ